MSGWITITLETSHSAVDVANSVLYANRDDVVELGPVGRNVFGKTSHQGNPWFRLYRLPRDLGSSFTPDLAERPHDIALEQFLDNLSTPFDRYAVAESNDTDDSSDVVIFEPTEEGRHTVVDTIEGATQANGADVAEDSRERHGFDILSF